MPSVIINKYANADDTYSPEAERWELYIYYVSIVVMLRYYRTVLPYGTTVRHEYGTTLQCRPTVLPYGTTVG